MKPNITKSTKLTVSGIALWLALPLLELASLNWPHVIWLLPILTALWAVLYYLSWRLPTAIQALNAILYSALAYALWITMPTARAADIKISAMPSASTLGGADLVPIVQGGANKTATFTLIDTRYQLLDGDLTAIAALTGTHTIYYRSATSTWSAVTIDPSLTFSGATLSVSTPTPTATATPTPTPTPTASFPIIVAVNHVAAQHAANSSITTFTVDSGTDGSFEVSMNMNVTVATVISTSLNCDYTDESNTARTMIFPTTSLSGAFLSGGLIITTGAFETPAMHIRCQKGTVITLYTAPGTYNTVTYSADGIIKITQ